MSKTFIGIHIVFGTKCRKRTIPPENRRPLFAYIHSIILANKCKTIHINGIGDHVHIALDLSPMVALSELVRDIKRSSSLYMKPSNGFSCFEGWGKGYYAASFSYDERDAVIEYIKSQETHHLGEAFEHEMEWMSLKAGLQYYKDDWL